MRKELGFTPTPEQADFILAWYELDDEGEFLYRRGILERAKGWGKSPLAGAISLAEFRGPVVFTGRFDAKGDPVGEPPVKPWVQIAAVSEDQAENTYGAIYELLTANDHAAAKSLAIDDGRTRLYIKDQAGAKLEPVTASAGSREGQRLRFAVLDETHLWTKSNGGHKLARTIRRNAAKMGGRTLETTNAPILGEKSVAEASDPHNPDPGVLHDAKRPEIEPDPSWSDERLLEALAFTYGDAYWVGLPRLVAEMRDPATPWDDVLRFYFNIRTAGHGRAVDPRRWDELASPRDVPAGTYIGLGFDGSINEDETWLRGCLPDGYRFTIGRWARPAGAAPDWKVPRSEVHQKVEWAFTYYRVGRMFCDPFKWWTEVEQWAEKYGNDSEDKPRVLVLDTNQERRFAPPVDRWLTAIREGSATHDGDPAAAEHVKAAHLRRVRATELEIDGRTRYVLVKGDDRKRIDGAVADVLALEAAMTMPPDKPVVVPQFIPFD